MLGYMEEAWPRLWQPRKDMEHTPGTEQEAAWKRGFFERTDMHAHRVGTVGDEIMRPQFHMCIYIYMYVELM